MIQTHVDVDLNAFIAEFPVFTTLECLHEWGKGLLSELEHCEYTVALLVDTNEHKFESVACLKWLRTFLVDEPIVKSIVSRVAFVQPAEYRRPEVVSDVEAYFSNIEDARQWLRL